MKKGIIIGCLLVVLGGIGIAKGIQELLLEKQRMEIISSSCKESGICFGRFGPEDYEGLTYLFISLPILAIGISLIVKKEHRF